MVEGKLRWFGHVRRTWNHIFINRKCRAKTRKKDQKYDASDNNQIGKKSQDQKQHKTERIRQKYKNQWIKTVSKTVLDTNIKMNP